MILHCWDCGAKTVRGGIGLGENLDSYGIFTWCPKCKKYPSDFYENKVKSNNSSCMVSIPNRELWRRN